MLFILFACLPVFTFSQQLLWEKVIDKTQVIKADTTNNRIYTISFLLHNTGMLDIKEAPIYAAALSIQTFNKEGEILSNDTSVNSYGTILTSFTDTYGQLYFIIQLGNPYDTATIHIGNYLIPPSERSGQYLVRYSPEKSYTLAKKIPIAPAGLFNENDNSIVLAHFFHEPYTINGNSVKGLVIIKYSYQGEIVSIKQIPTNKNAPTSAEIGTRRISLDDAGNYYLLTGDDSWGFWMKKLDKDFNVIWSKHVPGDVFADYVVDKKGQGILAMNFCGSVTIEGQTLSGSNSDFNCGGYIARFDKNGNKRSFFKSSDSLYLNALGLDEASSSYWTISKLLASNSNVNHIEKHDHNDSIIYSYNYGSCRQLDLSASDNKGNCYVYLNRNNYQSCGGDNSVLYKFGKIQISSAKEESIVFTSLSVFPNPTAGKFEITCDYSEPNVTIQVLNSIGQKVFENQIKTSGPIHEAIDLGKYSKGIYMVLLRAGEMIETRKVILE